jgi:cytochrome c oxidase subunit 2
MVLFSKGRSTILAGALTALLFLVLAACTSPQNTFEPRSNEAESVLTIYIVVIAAASFVGAAVTIAVIIALIRFRARPGHKARQIHGNNKLEIAWTIAPIFVLMTIAFPTIFWIVGTTREPAPNAIEILATGHQWWFEFEYPGLGPNGTSLYTANELRVPVGREIAITLESDDVIHSFWVPALVGKTDMIPTRTNKLQLFTPNEIGEFWGQCAEFCGAAHALMRFRVHVDSLGDFGSWVQSMNSAPAEPSPGSAEARGQRVYELAGACGRCHSITGTASQGKIGPDLTLFGDRSTVGAGILDNTDENLRAWIRDVRSLKPITDDGGVAFMPTFKDTLSDAQVADVAAYLKSLILQ